MKEDVIARLARKHLDYTITVYFANEYIKGHWYAIDLHENTISIHRQGKKNQSVIIDIDCITAIEVEDHD